MNTLAVKNTQAPTVTNLRLDRHVKSMNSSGRIDYDPYCVSCAIDVAEDEPYDFEVLTDAQQWKKISLPLCDFCSVRAKVSEMQTPNFLRRIHQAANRKLSHRERAVNFKLIE